MKLKTEQYKGYPIKFVEKIIGKYKVVCCEFKSKITGRILGSSGTTKQLAYEKAKKLIDKEVKKW